MPTDTNTRNLAGSAHAQRGWQILQVAGRTLLWTPFCILVIMGLSFLLHTFFHFCPFTFSVICPDEEVPMQYGYYFSAEPEPEWKDKIALGGCMVIPISTHCPHCGWPMRYCDPSAPDAMPDLDVITLFAASLNEKTKASLRTQVDMLKCTKLGDANEAVVAAAIGESDLWLATRNQGLHRMDLATGVWATNRDSQPWRCFVKSMAITGNTVQVEYCPLSAPTYFQTATTCDGGRTWRLASGSLPLLP